jgi:hypothetical protein
MCWPEPQETYAPKGCRSKGQETGDRVVECLTLPGFYVDSCGLLTLMWNAAMSHCPSDIIESALQAFHFALVSNDGDKHTHIESVSP